VSFSILTMNGYTDALSLDVDRSSGNLVLQTYPSGSNKTEYGTCKIK